MSWSEAKARAQRKFFGRFLPTDVTNWQSIAATVQFGPFQAGDQVIIICDAPAHVNAKAIGGAAIATNPQLPAGVHDWVVPAVFSGSTEVGAVYVNLFGNGTGNAAVWKAL